MRKFIFLLIIGFLALGTFTSCDVLDKDLKCTYKYDVLVQIHNKDVQAAMEEYMDEQFVNKTGLPTYYGKYYDAKVQFIEYFTEALKEVDNEFILSQLTEEGDTVVLECLISSSWGLDMIGYKTWLYQAPEAQ